MSTSQARATSSLTFNSHTVPDMRPTKTSVPASAGESTMAPNRWDHRTCPAERQLVQGVGRTRPQDRTLRKDQRARRQICLPRIGAAAVKGPEVRARRWVERMEHAGIRRDVDRAVCGNNRSGRDVSAKGPCPLDPPGRGPGDRRSRGVGAVVQRLGPRVKPRPSMRRRHRRQKVPRWRVRASARSGLKAGRAHRGVATCASMAKPGRPTWRREYLRNSQFADVRHPTIVTAAPRCPSENDVVASNPRTDAARAGEAWM